MGDLQTPSTHGNPFHEERLRDPLGDCSPDQESKWAPTLNKEVRWNKFDKYQPFL